MKPRKERSRWGRSADESANENNKKGGDFEKPPSFCIMSVNAMLFLGERGGKANFARQRRRISFTVRALFGAFSS